METSKKKKTNTQSRKSLLRQHYPLMFAILIAVMLFFYSRSMIGLSQIKFSSVLYPHQRVGVFINFAVLHFVFPSSFLVIFIAVFKRNISKNRTTNARVSDFFTLILTCLSCLATLMCIMILRFETDTYYHKDTLRLTNHTYTLSFHDSIDVFANRNVVLYDCENSAFFCPQIYETSRNYDRNYQIELAFDETIQELSIVINGEAVHTHQLEDQ